MQYNRRMNKMMTHYMLKFAVLNRVRIISVLYTNYYYATTIVFSFILTICYSFFLNKIDSVASTNNFWNIYLISFNHSGIIHITFNVIMFALISLLLERHFGSFVYCIMLIGVIPLSNITYFAAKSLLKPTAKWSGCGESCVNCFLLGTYLVVISIYRKQYFMTKRIFLTLIPLALCLFFFSVNYSNISNPNQFFANPQLEFMYAFKKNVGGHFAPFIIGIIVSILIYLIAFTNKFINTDSND